MNSFFEASLGWERASYASCAVRLAAKVHDYTSLPHLFSLSDLAGSLTHETYMLTYVCIQGLPLVLTRVQTRTGLMCGSRNATKKRAFSMPVLSSSESSAEGTLHRHRPDDYPLWLPDTLQKLDIQRCLGSPQGRLKA